MSVFRLKRGDTLPILKVILWETNPASLALRVHDLTGSSGWWLHIRLASGVALKRAMVVDGAPTLGTLRYAWLTTDWTEMGIGQHCMEYEVLGPAGARLTFPNGGDSQAASYDTLIISADLGDG